MGHLAEYKPYVIGWGNLDVLLALFAFFPIRSRRRDDDWSDRLNRMYTSTLLMVFAFVASAQMLIGNPITCWVPAEFHRSHILFTNNYCWLQNTYYLPFDKYIPKEGEKRRVVIYYQWVPFILLTQALFFYIPGVLWHWMCKKSGFNVNDIIESARLLQHVKKAENRTKWLKFVGLQFNRYVNERKAYKPGFYCDIKKIVGYIFCNCCGRDQGNYLVIFYIICKLLYIANLGFQILILNVLLGSKFYMYGVDFIRGIIDEDKWIDSESYFPRVTMCDVNVRRLGNLQRYTVQCVLPINIYTEKIYLFLWFWMLFVAMVMVYSLIKWLLLFLYHPSRISFIKKLLLEGQISPASGSTTPQLINKFVRTYLRQDGVFLLKLIFLNTSEVTVADMTVYMWGNFIEKVNKGESLESVVTSRGENQAFPLINRSRSQSREHAHTLDTVATSSGENQTLTHINRNRSESRGHDNVQEPLLT